MKEKWNKWGWFGGVWGSTIPLYLIVIISFTQQGYSTKNFAAFTVAVSVSIVGVLLWKSQENLAISVAGRIFICCFYAAAIAICSLLQNTIGQDFSFSQAFWTILMVSISLFAQYGFIFTVNEGNYQENEILVKTFTPSSPTIDNNIICHKDSWHITTIPKKTFQLYQYVPDQPFENCLLVYKLKITAQHVKYGYPEMWIKLPNRQEYFSRGVAKPFKPGKEQVYKILFFLRKNEYATQVKLNILLQDADVYIHEISLLKRLPV